MRELPKAIPDVDALLNLQPEELGAKLLFLMRERLTQQPNFMPHLGSAQNEIRDNRHDGSPMYPTNRATDVELAMAEAWAWLEAQGLLVRAAGQIVTSDFRVLSRRARSFENEAEFANYAVSRMLQRDALHLKIAQTVWMAFMRNEYDVAVFQAMKAVEVAVRDATPTLPGELVGVRLMRQAFHPQTGPLTDMEAEEGEREALSALFAGAIGTYKNPHSHRDVQLADPRTAVEIIMLANHLLRIVDSRRPG
jgi:uncharacterized protein (TIGR02391 family)